MKHSKAVLKLNINVRKAIDLAINNIEELQKIEYSADWSNFPNSLEIECFLIQIIPTASVNEAEEEVKNIKMIQHCFLKQGIKFRDIRKNITFHIEKK
jgi:hypothetical protein